MSKDYEVDDILAEIKRKKASKQSGKQYISTVQQATPPVEKAVRPAAKPAARPKLNAAPEIENKSKFPYESVSAQADRDDEVQKPSRFAKLYEDNPEPSPLRRRLGNTLNKVNEYFAPDENEEEYEDDFGKPIPAPTVKKQVSTKTNWSRYSSLDDEDEDVSEDTRVNLPKLGRSSFFTKNNDDDDNVFGFGDSTQELPSRMGRKLGRGGVQMDFAMEEDEYDPIEKSYALTHKTTDLAPENDYNSSSDKAKIISGFIKKKKGLVIRLALSLILLVISLYLSFSAQIQALPLPEFMWPERDMRNFITVHTVIGMLSMIVCHDVVGTGLISLFRMRANANTLPAVAGIAAVVQGIVFLSRPEAAAAYGGTLLFSVVILCFLFNILGHIMQTNRIVRNFKLVSSDCVKYSMNLIDNKEFLRCLTNSIDLDSYEIAYPQPTKHLAAFLDNSYSEDPTDNLYRYLAPICIFGALVMSIVCFFASGKQLLPPFHAFAAILAVCSSFTAALTVNLPLDRLSSLLTQEGGMVSGYSAVEECSHLEGVTLNDYDLIHSDSVILHGIKTFDESRIDEIITDAASVILSQEGTLTSVFNQLIGGNTKMLRPVQSFNYEDNMGISAYVDGKQILIGNREQLKEHGITPPPADFERRFTSDGREVLYLSSAGQLCSMFVLSYRMDDETLNLTDRLADEGIVLFVNSCNANLTTDKLSELMDYPKELLHIFPAETHSMFNEQCVLRDKAAAKVGFMGRNTTMIKSIIGAINVKSSISLGIILQVFSIMVGYGILTFLCVRGEIAVLSFTHLLLYQGIWAAIVLTLPNIRKLL